MKIFTLEVCVDTLESARNAIRGGADRLELCGSLVIGGISPSSELYQQIRKESDIKIHAMVRPRFGDFLYTDSEIEIMLEETRMWRKLGADGIVSGILLKNGDLDIPRMKMLREEAGDMNFTLHRAFDVARDPMKTLEDAREAGVTAILTSGQQPKADDGMELLRRLVEASGSINIMPGSGITVENVGLIRLKTNAKAFHLSGNAIKSSSMEFRREEINMGIPGMSEFERWECDESQIAAVKRALEETE